MVIYIWKMNLTLQFIKKQILTVPHGILKTKNYGSNKLDNRNEKQKNRKSIIAQPGREMDL